MSRPGYVFSPLLILIALLAAFEAFARLPFVLYTLSHPETGAAMQANFFATFAPADVIAMGGALVVIVLMMALLAGLIAGAGVPGQARRIGLPKVPAALYLVALPFLLAAPLAITMLGADALIEDISGKRSEVGDAPLMWMLLKLAFFCHVIACLFYIRLVQTGRLIDKLAFALTLLAVVGPAVVFSQRAVLIALAVEIFYLQIVLGRFSLRRALKLTLVFFPVLMAISILRPTSTDMSLAEALLFGFEKIVSSRYFLDFTKLGVVALWASENNWLGPVAISFLFEPFGGSGVLYYKEIGPMIGSDIYLMRQASGVTPGLVLELILSFGTVLGLVSFGLTVGLLLRLERRLICNMGGGLGQPVFLALTLSKFTLLLNSSIGAFCFQLVVEGVLLAIALYALNAMSWAAAELTRRPHAPAITSRAPAASMRRASARSGA